MARSFATTFALLIIVINVNATPKPSPCNVVARIESGWVCGLTRWAEAGTLYASFRGVPYAKQPIAELRFKELQPLEPQEYYIDATEEGPVCPQTDVLYGRIMRPKGFSEACIHANIHVPLEALPRQPPNELDDRYWSGSSQTLGLPILVFIHGGGFAFGSGDADLHGPEYLVSRKIIVITFNYRLNVLGFLSLNSTSIPGNNGLRDMVTLLRWVQRNARAFGGNPDDVTIMGQSAGASSAHMLTMSEAARGLFKRAILMSGNGLPFFHTASPAYSQFITKLFLSLVDITSTDPEEVHQKLIEMPIEKITEANNVLLDQFGITTFFPVVETPKPGITTILEDDPEVLFAKGRGSDIPLLIGFTNSECETFRRRMEQIDIISRIQKNPSQLVPVNTIFSNTPDVVDDISKRIIQRYFNGTLNIEKYLNLCSDSFFMYPALRLAEKRAEAGIAPVFLYKFSYDGDNSVFKKVDDLKFEGAGHIEDLTYVFRVNSILEKHFSYPPRNRDDHMKYWMTMFVTNFMKCSDPVCSDNSSWPAVNPNKLGYQHIQTPNVYQYTELTKDEMSMKHFFDSFQKDNYVNGVK
nr:juvenile hormone esterase [Antheraea pernyi]